MPPRASTLEVPATTASLETVRRFVEEHARRAGLPDDVVESVKLAVDEACANVVKHAYAGEDGHAFSVTVGTPGRDLVVRIRHTGQAFDPATYRGPLALADAARQRRKGGFGVFLMQRLMDEVDFRTRAGVSEVRLVKHRPTASAAPTAV